MGLAALSAQVLVTWHVNPPAGSRDDPLHPKKKWHHLQVVLDVIHQVGKGKIGLEISLADGKWVADRCSLVQGQISLALIDSINGATSGRPITGWPAISADEALACENQLNDHQHLLRVFYSPQKTLCFGQSKIFGFGAEAALIGCCSHRPFCFLMMVQIMQISGNFPGHGTPATHPVLIPMNKRVPSTRFQFEISSFFSRGRLMCATRAASFNARIPPPLFLRRQVTALIGGKMSSDSLPPVTTLLGSFEYSKWRTWIELTGV